MNVKKRFILIGLFVIQQFFISFIINCGEDSAYDQTQIEEENDANANETACNCEGFLTDDCVDECQDASDAEEEENADDNEAPATDSDDTTS